MANGVYEYKDFYASHDHMPGSAQDLCVTGTVVFRTGGFRAELKELEKPGGANPAILHLVLHIDPPAEGEAVTEALAEVPVKLCLDNPPIEYSEVEFRVDGTLDDPPPNIAVEHPR